MPNLTPMNEAQLASLKRKWEQDNNGFTFEEFRATVVSYADGTGCVMVKWCNMWLGIERDGYTHS